MSSISSGTTTTTGYVVSSDTTGALVLKTGASGTTALTIGSDQSVTFVGSQTLSGGTANGVLYLNGSKVVTSGSALTFDGTLLRSSTYLGLSANTTPDTSSGDAIFYKGSVGAGLSGYSLVFDTGSAGSRSEKMRLDASGNLLVGTTSGLSGSGAYGVFGNSSAGGANRWAAYFGTNSGGASAAPSFGLTLGWNYSAGGGESNIVYGVGAGSTPALAFSSSNGTTVTERARIDSSGNLLVGNTGTPSSAPVNPSIQTGSLFANIGGIVSGNSSVVNIQHSGGSYYGIMLKNGSTGTSNALTFVNSSNSVIGTIVVTTTATSYNTASDYRLKNTIAPMTGALAKVAQLKPVTYKWNSDGSDGEGFIAHELAEVCPDAVTGEKDGLDKEGNPKYQGIDTSFLVATLTAAIQEQQALIESLTTRITALEGAQA